MQLKTNNDYAHVIDTFGNLVYRLCFVYLKNQADADDAYQDIFVKLVEKQPTFHDEEHMKAWLIKVTTNHCKNILRFQRFHKTTEVKEDIPTQTSEEDRMLTLVLQLPLKYRNVLYLHYYEGYPFKDIATLLNTNEATIRTRAKRAKEALKITIEKEETYA